MPRNNTIDLNIGTQCLDNWENHDACRELIANAMDEHIISKITQPISINHSRNKCEIIDYKEFLNNIKINKIYLDPGTHIGNTRPYMQWRAENKWFDQREENNLDDKYIMTELSDDKIEKNGKMW